MTAEAEKYAVRLQIDYPDRLDRVTTFFRLIWIIPVAIILSLLTASGGDPRCHANGRDHTEFRRAASWAASRWRPR